MAASPMRPAGCAAVNELIGKPIPSTLWHYTSYEGFLGIIKSKKIWASEYRFLNDLEEFSHAKNLALKLIEEEPKLIGQDFPAQDLLRKSVNIAFNTGVLHPERLRVFVASFSQVADQLSQWRGYSRNSTGVSVGLDLRGLRPPPEVQTTAIFARCIYAEQEKGAHLKAVFAHFTSGLQEYWDSVIELARQKQAELGLMDEASRLRLIRDHFKDQEIVVKQAQSELSFDLLRLGPLLKNESFSEEQEWRLVLPISATKRPEEHPLEFRASANGVVPYVAYPLRGPNEKEDSAPCNDLILGPGSHPSAGLGVDMFLDSLGVRVVARPSKVPYRPG